MRALNEAREETSYTVDEAELVSKEERQEKGTDRG